LTPDGIFKVVIRNIANTQEQKEMEFNSVDELKANEFLGFKTIGDLFISCSDVSEERGNYLVLYLDNRRPEFVAKGVGGFFKGEDPNVPIRELESNWVVNTIVVNIAQAGGIRAGKWSNQKLNDRIKTYMKFGQGQNIGHKGGRYIWQIRNYKDLVLCWHPLPNKMADPKKIEGELIQDFKRVFGKRPFANLQD
jgi:hypothetical protein